MPESFATINGIDEARAALARERAPTLVSAPGAGATIGPGFWRAMIDTLRDEYPDMKIRAILDCGASPGAAMAALRSGIDQIVFTGHKDAAAKLKAMAETNGAVLHRRRP
ncbi:MAG: hypothetical protein U9N14_06510 [Pseudomonadota bacterium]|nr:hypothetical protein [Pseudomonadota bacterium]